MYIYSSSGVWGGDSTVMKWLCVVVLGIDEIRTQYLHRDLDDYIFNIWPILVKILFSCILRKEH